MKQFRFVLSDKHGNMVCAPFTRGLADEQSATDFVTGMCQAWRLLKYGERLNIEVSKLNVEKNLWEHWLRFSEF